MAWCPFATRVPIALNDWQKRGKITSRGIVKHTAVTGATLLKPTGSIRWTWYLNWDAKLYQFFDTEVAVACQLDGNYWFDGGKPVGFNAIETADGAYTDIWPDPPGDWGGGPPWNEAQYEMLVRLEEWHAEEHGIPLVVPSNARGRGYGWHNLFSNTSPYEWNRTHACPGLAREGQSPEITDDAAEGEDEMAWLDNADNRKTFANDIAKAVANNRIVDDILPREEDGSRTRSRLAHQIRTARRDSHNQPERVWRHRVPWWGNWDAYPFTDSWPDGYTAEANLVHIHRLVRDLMHLVVDQVIPLLEAGLTIPDEKINELRQVVGAITAAEVVDHIDVNVELGVGDADPATDPPAEEELPADEPVETEEESRS